MGASKGNKIMWLFHSLLTVLFLFFFRVPIIAGPVLLLFALHTYIRWEDLTGEEKEELTDEEAVLRELEAMGASVDCDEIRRVLEELQTQKERLHTAIGKGSEHLKGQLLSTTLKTEEREAMKMHLDAVVGAENKLDDANARQRQILHQLKAFRVYLLQLDSEEEGLDLDERVKALKETLELSKKITF